MNKKILIISLVLLISNAFAGIRIDVETEAAIRVKAHAVYKASRDSFFCKDSYWDEGGARRVVPKRKHISIEQEDDFVIMVSLIDSYCEYELINDGSLSFYIPQYANAISTKNIVRVAKPKLNVIKCRIIIYGPQSSQSPHLLCNDGDHEIEVDSQGRGSVKLLLID